MLKPLLVSALALLAPFGSFAGAQTCSPTPFVQATRLMNGKNVVAVAVGEVTGDSIPDIVAMVSDGRVYVLPGAGDGTFFDSQTPAANFQNISPSLLVVDVNDDGKLDLVSADYSALVVMLGNGDGTFQAPVRSTHSPTSYYDYPVTLAAGDFDHNGTVDVVVSSYYQYAGNRATVIKGNGDGTFSSPHDLVTGYGAHRLAVAELNGDSYPEVLATNYQDGTVSVFRGDASGLFPAPRTDFATGVNPFDLSVADIDNDGKLDLAVSVSTFVSILRGKGNGSFDAAYEYSSLTSNGVILATDLDGDGRSDVITAGNGYSCCSNVPGTVTIFLSGPGASLGQPFSYLGPMTPAAIAAVDIDGDGKKDILVAGFDGLAILRGLGPQQFLASPLISAVSYVSIDSNEDGRAELLGSTGNSITSTVWSPINGFVTSTLRNFTDPVSVLAAGDFNGDGHADIIVNHTSLSTPYTLSFLGGNGDGSFRNPVTIPLLSPVTTAVVGDFNGDGKLDLVVSSQYDSLIHLYLGNGDGTFQSPSDLQPPAGITLIRSADLNLDGIADLVVEGVASPSSSMLTVYLGSVSGLGAPISRVISGLYFDVADLDGDTRPDLIVTGGPSLALYRGFGDGTFQDPVNIGLSGTPVVAVVGDFDHDGIADIASVEVGRISLMRGLGGLVYDSPVDQYVGITPQSLAAIDVTGGGVPDLLASINFGNGPQLIIFPSAVLAATAPSNQVSCISSDATFKTSASGYGPVTYQWRKNGAPLVEGAKYVGTKTPVLSVHVDNPADFGLYDVGVTDLCTTVISGAATLTVLAQPAAPTIGPASVPTGLSPITVTIASPAPPGGAAVLVNGFFPSTIPEGATSVSPVILTGGAGSLFFVTAFVTINGCPSPVAVATIFADYTDVPAANPFREFVNTLARNGVTAGCGIGNYCPDNPVTRSQMAVFLLRSKDGATYVPPACTTATFPDVPCSSGFAPWVDEIAARGVTAGCGGGNYCPFDSVTRAQMAVFLLRTHDGPTYVPPACTTAPFADVPCASPFAPWIQELVVRGITAGCGNGNFCPDAAVSRGQMAVLLVETFQLQ